MDKYWESGTRRQLGVGGLKLKLKPERLSETEKIWPRAGRGHVQEAETRRRGSLNLFPRTRLGTVTPRTSTPSISTTHANSPPSIFTLTLSLMVNMKAPCATLTLLFSHISSTAKLLGTWITDAVEPCASVGHIASSIPIVGGTSLDQTSVSPTPKTLFACSDVNLSRCLRFLDPKAAN